ncbi:MarR family winged helix-turn-helix transcriptional regulator [Herbiconiux sp. UC225_62]|uniref:MarR family winged helix-turn-helix transcriptional regulator n=1 Tax=Herbiconiux sp. UC225_62 TaxID=3350168 RepID=UPI0036D3E164
MTDTAGGARPPFSPTIALLTLSRSVEAELVVLLKPYGLTVRKYGMLGHIRGTPGISYSELGRRSGITVQSVHTLIASLVEAGLVASAVDSSGLAARLTVAPRGDEVLGAIERGLVALDERIFAAPEMSALADALAGVLRERMSGGPSGASDDEGGERPRRSDLSG